MQELIFKNKDQETVFKFNPYHDAKGRFATANGATSFTFNPSSKAGANAIAREKEKRKQEDEEKKKARAGELLKQHKNINEDEAKQLVDVERHYQEKYADDRKVDFRIWENYGKKRAYTTLPWRSKYANSFGSFYDFKDKYLFDRYDSKQF